MESSCAAEDYRIVRMSVWGVTYTPILSPSGHALGPAEAQLLAEAPDPQRAGQGLRRVRFVLCDESRPRFADSPPGFRLERPLEYEPGRVALTLGQHAALIVGRVDSVELLPPGTTPGTEGVHAIGVATLSDSLLAAIVWQGIVDGVLDGVCAELNAFARPEGADPRPERDLTIGGTLLGVGLGNLEDSCLPSCRVLGAWEEEPWQEEDSLQ